MHETEGRSRVEAATVYPRDKRHLLVLDNFEQVVMACDPRTVCILRSCHITLMCGATL
jgi:predicted ATPase